MRIHPTAALIGGAIVLAGCSEGSGSRVEGDGPVRVEDALGAAVDESGQEVSVSGAILLQGEGAALLCDHPLDSNPPMCGAPGLPVESVDVAGMPGSATTGGISWIEDITVHGRLLPGGVDVADELTQVPEDQANVGLRLRHETP